MSAAALLSPLCGRTIRVELQDDFEAGGGSVSVTNTLGVTSTASGPAFAGGADGVSRAGMDYTPPVRTGAFKAAGRHTARVRFLRRFIILGAVFGVSVIAIVAAFDPFKHLPHGVSISGVGVKGTKITLDTPKLTGVQQGGGAYKVEAKTGIQDLTTPSTLELLGVDAHIGMADKTMTHVLSNHGLYDNKADTFALEGDVKIANSSGYRFGLKSALIDFKNGTLTSRQRMRVDLDGGDVLADEMTISNNGHVVAFVGHVHSTFESGEQPQPAIAGLSAQAAPGAVQPVPGAAQAVGTARTAPSETAPIEAEAQEVLR